jgi:hypothetical protein
MAEPTDLVADIASCRRLVDPPEEPRRPLKELNSIRGPLGRILDLIEGKDGLVRWHAGPLSNDPDDVCHPIACGCQWNDEASDG